MALFLVIVGFGWLIFVHEFGHFIVAKWAGVRCPQFAIGFGKAICSWRRGIGFRLGSTEPEFNRRAKKRLEEKGIDPEEATVQQINEAGDELNLGETEYRVNYLVILGGYVKMVGQEDLDPAAASDDPRSFTRQKIWKRACILSAGVVMNLIFGLLFLIIAFMIGIRFPPAIVGGVVPGSPAATTYAVGHAGQEAYQGLEADDKIIKVNGKEPIDLQDVQIATALTDPDSYVQLTVKRSGLAGPLVYKLQPRNNSALGRLTTGIIGPSNLNVVALLASGPAAAQGLETQMRLVKINGQRVETYGQFRKTVLSGHGQSVVATFIPYDSAGKLIKGATPVNIKLSALPSLSVSKEGVRNILGFVPAVRVEGVADKLPGRSSTPPAAAAGIKKGDVLAQVGSFHWPDRTQLITAIRQASKENKSIDIKVWRAGEVIDLGKLKPVNGRVGIVLSDAHLRISRALANSPASDLNLPGGSKIISINGKKVSSWAEMQRRLGNLVAEKFKPSSSAKGMSDGSVTKTVSLPVLVQYQLNLSGQPVESKQIILGASAVKQLKNMRWLLPADIGFGQMRVRIGSANPIAAAQLGLIKTKDFMIQTYISVLRLIQGSVSVKQLRGPVGIVQIGTSATEQGWAYLLFFLGVISINLAVINFFPIPVLDGGHILFLIIEKLKGSPVRASIQVAALVVGLVVIFGFMLFVTYNDIVRLITG